MAHRDRPELFIPGTDGYPAPPVERLAWDATPGVPRALLGTPDHDSGITNRDSPARCGCRCGAQTAAVACLALVAVAAATWASYATGMSSALARKCTKVRR